MNLTPIAGLGVCAAHRVEAPAQQHPDDDRQALAGRSRQILDFPPHRGKGYKSTWVGYKLHIDVADGQASRTGVEPPSRCARSPPRLLGVRDPTRV